MAIGGMIGGGIFSVLGVTIQLAGHLAFLCFMLAGAVALVTAHAYAALTRRAGRSGGPYAYLRAAGHPQLAAITSWFLVLGYIVALAVYAFTFGHYAAAVIGAGGTVARVAAVAVLAAFWAINRRGAAASTLTEDGVVAAKLVILAVITGIGLLSWSSSRLDPLPSEGYLGVFVGAASIFVAYEGFGAGSVTRLAQGDFTIEPTGIWKRDPTCSYPSSWILTVKGEHFIVDPTPADQEVRSLYGNFWDGETAVGGSTNGRGIAELLNYCYAPQPQTQISLPASPAMPGRVASSPNRLAM